MGVQYHPTCNGLVACGSPWQVRSAQQPIATKLRRLFLEGSEERADRLKLLLQLGAGARAGASVPRAVGGGRVLQ